MRCNELDIPPPQFDYRWLNFKKRTVREFIKQLASLVSNFFLVFKIVTMSFTKLGKSLPFSSVFRKLEQDMETVIRVLQPGPVGIVEHKFTNEEIRKASSMVRSAVANWRTRAMLEKHDILKDFIEL